jgi:hypothetical protein
MEGSIRATMKKPLALLLLPLPRIAWLGCFAEYEQRRGDEGPVELDSPDSARESQKGRMLPQVGRRGAVPADGPEEDAPTPEHDGVLQIELVSETGVALSVRDLQASERQALPVLTLHWLAAAWGKRETPEGGWALRAGLQLPEGEDAPLRFSVPLPSPRPRAVALCFHAAVIDEKPIAANASRVRLAWSFERLQASLGSIRMRLVDAENGEALWRGGIAAMGPRDRRGRADGEGRVSLDGLPAGAYELEARVVLRERLRWRILLGPGESLDLGEVPLERGATLRLRVAPHGEGDAKTLRLSSEPGSVEDPQLATMRTARVGGDGRCEPIEQLPAGRYVVMDRWSMRRFQELGETANTYGTLIDPAPPRLVVPMRLELRTGEERELQLQRVPACMLTLELDLQGEGPVELSAWTATGIRYWSMSLQKSAKLHGALARGGVRFDVRGPNGQLMHREAMQLPAGAAERTLRLR